VRRVRAALAMVVFYSEIQTQMTVHVRKLNRGMKQSTILKQSINQAKQQKPVPGAEFQKEFKKFQIKLN
jgi:hypothetical protein